MLPKLIKTSTVEIRGIKLHARCSATYEISGHLAIRQNEALPLESSLVLAGLLLPLFLSAQSRPITVQQEHIDHTRHR